MRFTNNLAKSLLDGWQINGSFIAESGQPVTALSGQDANGDFDTAGDRAILNPNGTGLTGSGVNFVRRNPVTGRTSIAADEPDDPSLVVGYVATNSSARFIVAMPGTPDNANRVGRNTIRSIGLNTWNLSLFKNFRLMEAKYIQFRAEMYNAFNHRQFSLGLPTYQQSTANALSSTYSNVSSLQFLDASQFSGSSRTMQMSLKFIF